MFSVRLLQKGLLATGIGAATVAVGWHCYSDSGEIPKWKIVRLLNAASKDGPVNPRELNLKQVQIIVRHGARTPFQLMPGIEPVEWKPEVLMGDLPEMDFEYDIRTPEGGSRPKSAMELAYTSKKPLLGGCGVGQLTLLGKQQAYELGKKLKSMYLEDGTFLDPMYNSEDVYVRSSNMDRTILTAVGILAGMYGKDHFKETPTIYTMVNEHESMYPNYYFCKNLQQWTKRAFVDVHGLPGYAEALMQVAKALTVDKESAFKKINLPMIHDNFASRMAHGMSCPEAVMRCADLISRHGARFMAFIVCGDESNRDEVMKLSCGSFLDVITTRIDDALSHTHKLQKLHLYSGHDTTIITLLTALNVFDDKWPEYASNVILELYQDQSKEWFVRTLYNGKEIHIDDSHGAYYPAEKFQALLKRYVIKDWDLACGITKDSKTEDIKLGTL